MHLFKLPKAIYLNIGFLLLLLGVRIVYTQSLFFSFYIWNTFLAIVPIFLSNVIHAMNFNKYRTFAILMIWLLFFPNAAYLVTDVLHFKERKQTPLWYDLIIVVQASLVGLMCTVFSLNQIENVLNKYFKPFMAKISVILIIVATSYGVYLGRFLRFNSWDLFTTPILLTKVSIGSIFHPQENIKTWLFTIIFSAFIGLCYTNFKLIKT